MPRRTLLLLVTSALMACGLAVGQEPKAATDITAIAHDAIGKEVAGTGQLSEYVRRIFQDSRGHYWFGCSIDGIYRYDGSKLEVFATEEGLVGTQITGILEDRQGQIWISTTEGVSRFDPSAPLGTHAFTNYTKEDGLSSNGCWSIFMARDGTIWVGTALGPCRFDGYSFEALDLPKWPHSERAGYAVSSIAQDRKGHLWFGVDGGAVRYDGRSFDWLTTDSGLGGGEVACIMVDGRDRIWIGTRNGGLDRYNGRSMKHFTTPEIGNPQVWTVIEDRDGTIWFSSQGYGVYRYDGKSLKNFSTKQGLGVLAVQSIYQDREGRLWFGGGGGLYRLEGDTMVHVQRNGPWP